MANIVINKTAFLDAPITVDSLHGMTFTNESGAHQFVISAMQGGNPLALTGSVSARFMRANNTTILLTGSVTNGKAVITLHQDCYNVPGRFQLAIFNTVSGTTTCIYAAIGTVQRTVAGDLIDSGEAVPDISELLAQIDACEQATAAANAAATKAVRYDSAQTLTETQKAQARENIDGASVGDVNDLKSAFNETTITVLDGAMTPTTHAVTDWVSGWVRDNGTFGLAQNICRTGFVNFGSVIGFVPFTIKSGFKIQLNEYTTASESAFVGRVGEYQTLDYRVNLDPAHYYAITIKRTDNANFTPADIPADVLSYISYANAFDDEVSEIHEEIDAINFNTINPALSNNGYISATGQPQTNSGWGYSAFIPLDRCEKFIVNFAYSTSVVCNIAYYTSNSFATFVSGYYTHASDQQKDITFNKSDFPATARYVVFCGHKSYANIVTLYNKNNATLEDVDDAVAECKEYADEIASIPGNPYVSVFHDNFITQKADWVELNGENIWTFDTTNHTLTPTETGGYVNNVLTNAIGLNRNYAADKRTARVVVTLYSSTVMNIHLYRRATTGGYPNESMFVIDCNSGKLKMCKLNGRTIVPGEFVVTGDVSIVSGTKYVVDIIKNEQHYELKVCNFATRAEAGEIHIDDSWAGGSLIGFYGFSLASGTPFVIHSFDVSIIDHPVLCICGDSITEGVGASKPSKGFANLLRKQVPNSVISAEASDIISDIVARFDTEYSIIKPKVLFVTIGTNDPSVGVLYGTIKTKCAENGIKLYLNHIPTDVSGGMNLAEKNAVIDGYDVDGVMFDYVSHVNNDLSAAIDTTLFPDGIHPNDAGCVKMLERIMFDSNIVN